MNAGRAAYWLLVAATAAVYLAMVLWSLPRIAEMAGGLRVFDLRPGGYGADEARAFLTALTTEGRAFYLNVQHRLDLAYPALLFLVLAFAFRHLAPGPMAAILSAIAGLGAGFDYLENAAVADLLAQAPEAVTEAQVAAASRWTVAKSVASGTAMGALLALVVVAGLRRWRRRR